MNASTQPGEGKSGARWHEPTFWWYFNNNKLVETYWVVISGDTLVYHGPNQALAHKKALSLPGCLIRQVRTKQEHLDAAEQACLDKFSVEMKTLEKLRASEQYSMFPYLVIQGTKVRFCGSQQDCFLYRRQHCPTAACVPSKQPIYVVPTAF